MKNLIFSCTLFVGALLWQSAGLSAQTTSVWGTLTMLKYEQAGQDNNPFRKLVQQLEGQEVEVKGYIIPLTGQRAQSNFMFSKFPYNMCFFCGKAGPESVMEVYMDADQEVAFSEKPIVLKGIFRFYPGDPNQIMYKLEKAVLVER